MNMLEKFGLFEFKDNIVEDFNYFRIVYSNLSCKEDKRINIIKRKKEILEFIFESFASYFNFDYDIELKFEDEISDNDNVYLKDFNKLTFEQAFYKIYFECFTKYLSNLSKQKSSMIDEETYKLSRLIVLNNSKLIDILADNLYLDIVDERFDINVKNIERKNITNSQLKQLEKENEIRNTKLKIDVLSYKIEWGLSHAQIRNVYRCLSTDVFSKLNVNEKSYLMGLIHYYFNIEPVEDITRKYSKSIDKAISNKDALNIIIDDLMIKGRTMLIKKKNMNIVDDVLSGLSYVYSNEINKENVNSLDDLYDIKEKLKK